MTKAQDFASKLAVAFVAVAMVVSAFAPSAKAQSSEDLQKMINDLLAQVAALQGQVGQGSTGVASGVCPYTWTRDLSSGAKGGDVMKLQQFLNADPDTRVAATGAGSVGAETEFYGPATAAAVSKFQVKYRSEILSPAGLVNPTGYFGPSSRTSANAKCVVAPVVDTEDGDMEEDEDTDEEDETVTLSGEASLDTFEVESASDDTIEEGSEDAEIGAFQVTFSDGDASISRIDVALTNATVGADAWNAFETISLWVDGDKVAEEDADRKSDYLGDEDNGIIRFSGLDIIGMDDEEVEIVVAATIQGNLDTEELSTWTLGADSVRFFDADGVATTEDGSLVTSDTETFTLEVAGADDEVIVKTSSNDPDASTLQVEDNKKSDWYNVFTFDLDTDDSVNDITLNKVEVTVVVSSSTFNGLVDDYELVIDGVTIDTLADNNGATPGKYSDGATVVLTFDVDGDVTIDAGDRVAAELMLRFKSLAAGDEGTTVTGSVTAGNRNNIDAEGADDVTSLAGAATGDAHTLRTTGIAVSKESTSATVTTGDNAGDDYATFEIEVEVTAFEQDVFISTNVATSIVYSIVDGAGVVVAGTATPVLSSSADENSGYFEINEGETATITLQVTFDSTSTGAAARLRLDSIKFSDSAQTPDQTQTTLPETDYRTSIVTLVN